MMTSERFTDVWCSETGHIGVTDNGIDKEYTGTEFEEWLNELNDENEQLKQFKEDVFNKIDMHLRMLPTAKDNECDEEYTGAIYMLETLKMELEK